MLPYDTGFIYDLAFVGRTPTSQELTTALASSTAKNPSVEAFVEWLATEGIVVASDPAEIVRVAQERFPSLDALIV